jgi:adenylate cyclase
VSLFLSTLRTWLVLASIVVFSSLLLPLMQPLDRLCYDWCLKNAHDFGYDADRRHPALKLLSYSESTSQDLGEWTKDRTTDLASSIATKGALATVVHPAAQSELDIAPDPETGIYVAAPTPPDRSLVPVLDADGISRRVALAVKVDGQWRPTLPLMVFVRSQNLPPGEIRFLPSAIQVGRREIATDADYRLWVRFRRAPESLSGKSMDADDAKADLAQMMSMPFQDYLEHQGSFTKLYRDSVILVGSGFKQAQNLIQTPLGQLSDYLFHACVLETMLTGWTVVQPDGLETLFTLLAFVGIGYGIFRQLPIWGIAICWAFGQIGWLWLCQHVFTYGVYLQFTPFLLAVTLTAAFVIFKKLNEATIALRRFGGTGAAEAGQRGDESVLEEIREKTATIVFTNVLSYLKELERHGSPHDFFDKRQAYAQYLSDVFRKHGGVILDYQGDFQMIGFNVELREDDDDPDHALHAVQASQDFLDGISKVTNQWWEADEEEIGSAHCGICTGQVACGHVGSERHDGGRIAQAAIGDTSNVAARLLGAAMKTKEPILLAMTTVEASGGRIQVEQLEPIPLKGKTQAVPVARPVGKA